MSFLLSLAGWSGNLFIVAGLYGLGSKRRGAFVFSIVGEAFYIWRSYFARDWALLAVCCVFLLMAVRGLVLWADDERWVWNAIAHMRDDHVELTFDTDSTRRDEKARSLGRVAVRLEPRVLNQLRTEIGGVFIPAAVFSAEGGRRAWDIVNAIEALLTPADGYRVECGFTERAAPDSKCYVENVYNGTATITVLVNGGARPVPLPREHA